MTTCFGFVYLRRFVYASCSVLISATKSLANTGLSMRPARSRSCRKARRQRNWLGRQHNKFYWKPRRRKLLFFWILKRDLSFNFYICHKKCKIMNWIKHFITIIFMQDTCSVMFQSFKSFQLQTFLFFLTLKYPFMS